MEAQNNADIKITFRNINKNLLKKWKKSENILQIVNGVF